MALVLYVILEYGVDPAYTLIFNNFQCWCAYALYYFSNVSMSNISCFVDFQNGGAIIGKSGANIKRLRTDVSYQYC